jgi:hypothetical protein
VDKSQRRLVQLKENSRQEEIDLCFNVIITRFKHANTCNHRKQHFIYYIPETSEQNPLSSPRMESWLTTQKKSHIYAFSIHTNIFLYDDQAQTLQETKNFISTEFPTPSRSITTKQHRHYFTNYLELINDYIIFK